MSDDAIMKAVDPFWRLRTNDPGVTMPLDQWEKLRAELDALRAENARLRAAQEQLEAGHDSWRESAERWNAKALRLMAALEEAPSPEEYGADWLEWLIDLKEWFRTTRAEALK